MKIKKGDKVQVIAGKDKGVTGEVLAVYPETHKVVVEGVNILKKHVRPSQVNPEGGILSQEAPIDISNVMYYDTKSKKAGRVGYVLEGTEKTRVVKIDGKAVKIKAAKNK